jgi:NADPH:quinone reductase-like Zn-dependent oxidoreductase
VRVRAAGLNPKDVLVRKGKYRLFTGGRFPRGVGYDWAGEVAEVGGSVSGIAAGDRLFGMLNGWDGATCAEYVAVRPAECAPMPAGLSFEEAAAIPLSAQTALQALRDLGAARAGQRVLAHGASGGVGVFALQIAKALGMHVTSTSSARNRELCRSLGADETLDYASDDPFAPGRAYDLVFDVFGNRRFALARPALAPGGRYVTTVPSRRIVLESLATLLSSRRARLVNVRSRSEDLRLLAGWVEQGRLRPVVERVYGLGEVAAAHAALETKRTRGKLVVRID